MRVFGDEQDPCGQIVGGAVRVLVVNKTLAGAGGRNVLVLLVRERAQSCM